jgi:hypothetical protein
MDTISFAFGFLFCNHGERIEDKSHIQSLPTNSKLICKFEHEAWIISYLARSSIQYMSIPVLMKHMLRGTGSKTIKSRLYTIFFLL